MGGSDYPNDPEEWSEETVNRLIEERRREDSYLEFKSRFRNSRWEGDDRDADVRKEAMAFANNAGGHIIFGIKDDEDDAAENIGEIQEFSDDASPRREISNILQKIDPQITYGVNSFNIDGAGIVVVHVEEALRPPVMAPGEGTYYRHAEDSRPMTPDQIRGLFTEFSEREGAIRRLEKELQFFFDACDEYNFEPDGTRGPFFEPVNVSGLQQAIRGQHGLWNNDLAKRRIRGINQRLASLEMQVNDWERSSWTPPDPSEGLLGDEDEGMSGHEQTVQRLYEDVDQIWHWACDLIDECNLDVEIGNRP